MRACTHYTHQCKRHAHDARLGNTRACGRYLATKRAELPVSVHTMMRGEDKSIEVFTAEDAICAAGCASKTHSRGSTETHTRYDGTHRFRHCERLLQLINHRASHSAEQLLIIRDTFSLLDTARNNYGACNTHVSNKKRTSRTHTPQCKREPSYPQRAQGSCHWQFRQKA